MLYLLSPAKSLDEKPLTNPVYHSMPRLLSSSTVLADSLKQLSSNQIGQLMGISEQLSELNHRRYQQWVPVYGAEQGGKQAVLAFNGDVYEGLDASTLEKASLEYAQDHLRILSGLYGVLRPMDMILPYRLEMGCSLQVGPHKNLYAFWGDKLTSLLLEDLQASGYPVIVNLASNEYFKAIKSKQVPCRIITPVFKERKGDRYQVVSFYAKRARGLMARFAMQHRIDEPEALKAFQEEGYAYQEQLSSADEWTFVR